MYICSYICHWLLVIFLVQDVVSKTQERDLNSSEQSTVDYHHQVTEDASG